jgi:hypothetical protein
MDRRGTVIYFIHDRISRAVKIGVSNNPADRLGTLQTGNPNRMELLGHIRGDERDEARLHQQFAEYKVGGEWFKDDQHVMDTIQKLLEPVPRSSDSIIKGLSEALKEALIWLYIEGKQPPYRVPYAIDSDFWKMTAEPDRRDALGLIKDAVDKAAGYKV